MNMFTDEMFFLHLLLSRIQDIYNNLVTLYIIFPATVNISSITPLRVLQVDVSKCQKWI